MVFFDNQKRALKKMGFFGDQDGIVSRYTREKQNWDKHLEKAKSFILASAENAEKDSIAVLGSGWLLDVPINELAERFTDVYLYDIRHPQQIKHRLRNVSNIHFIEQDLTGGVINEIYAKCKNAPKKKPELLPLTSPRLNLGKTFDLTVSLNLLNQLDILIVEYIRQKFEYTDQQLLAFRKAIQESHLSFLKDQPVACLISDCDESVRNNESEAIAWNKPLVHCELPGGSISDEWIWEFDHSGYYYDNKTVDFRVQARCF